MCLLCGKKTNNCLVKEIKRCITKIIQQEKWNRLLSYLEATKKSTNLCLVAHALSSLQELIGKNALHVVCCLHPPLAVVTAIHEISPNCVQGVDKNGHTPLHSAVLWGAPPQVLDFLINCCPIAALKKECRGKTPLHLLCENCFSEKACDICMIRNLYLGEPLRRVLNSIIKAAPESINEEDFDGLSPIEIAINGDADADVVHALQRASEQAWRQAKLKRLHNIDLLIRKEFTQGFDVQHRYISDEHFRSGRVGEDYQERKKNSSGRLSCEKQKRRMFIFFLTR
jgi:ankyrin repeat protein